MNNFFRLSPNFTIDEFILSSTAETLGLYNTPPSSVLSNLGRLANELEKVRNILGAVPIHISSGYRCKELNSAVGGVPNSAHLYGLAADFSAPKYGAVEKIFDTLRASDLQFDQLIIETAGRASWIHYAIGAVDSIPRRKAFKMDKV